MNNLADQRARDAFKVWWRHWRKSVGAPDGDESDEARAAAFEAWMHQHGEFYKASRLKAGMEAAAKICDQGTQLMNSPMYTAACEEMAKGIREAAARLPADGRDELLDGMKRRIGSALSMGAEANAGENQQYLLNVFLGMQRFIIEWEKRHGL